MTDDQISPNIDRTALLVMDVQNGIVERFGEMCGPLLATLGETIDAARAAGVPVVYVKVAFREGVPEVSPRNHTFAAFAPSIVETTHAAQIHPAVEPKAGDIVVTKRRVSAFAGSDLDVVLRSQDINALVLTGIVSGGVVLSTLREAADRDFAITVLNDGCIDGDPEIQRVLMDKIFPRQAAVVSAKEWRNTLPEPTRKSS